MIAPGASHCIIPGNSLYTLTVDGTRVIDWLKGIVNGGDVTPQVVDCLSEGTCPPTLLSTAATNATTTSVAAAAAAAAAAGGRPLLLHGAWACAVAFSSHYTRMGFPQPNMTTTSSDDAAHVQRLYRDFAAAYCNGDAIVEEAQ